MYDGTVKGAAEGVNDAVKGTVDAVTHWITPLSGGIQVPLILEAV